MRRLNEELGFEAPLQLLFKFQYQVCSVYFGKANGIVRANPNEIAEWEYMDLGELNKDIKAQPHLYTPWFKMEWERIQMHHGIDIVNL